MIGGVLGHEGLGKVFLVALKLLDKQAGGINTGSLGISDLLLIEYKAVKVLIKSFLLNLLLIVLVIKVLKLREFDVFAVNSHEDRIPLSNSEDRSSQQQ